MAEKEYIEREALKALFDERYETAFMQMHTTDNREHWSSYSGAINWGRNTIADAPTANVVEVVHGYWIPCLVKFGSRNSYVAREKCSVCSTLEREQRKYCPECGAKMDGKNGEGK